MSIDKGIGLFQTFKSVLASFIGIQSKKKHTRDFTKGRARDFVIMGIITTFLFILLMLALVKLAMNLVS
tara:strand:- start:161 stop:367 length:207 start_codon:yes stop_codon:yes gene_type:complete